MAKKQDPDADEWTFDHQEGLIWDAETGVLTIEPDTDVRLDLRASSDGILVIAGVLSDGAGRLEDSYKHVRQILVQAAPAAG